MKISIRMDDITPDMDWTKFLRFKALCDQYQVKPLIGIVPDNQDENLHIADTPEDVLGKDFWEYIRELERAGWCVAQHGVTHRYTTKKMGCFPLNKISEFAGLEYKHQFKMLREGKRILSEHGVRTDIFMAPAHSFDRSTIKALRKLGFCKMTDGFGDFPYMRWGMTFYPISYQQSSVLRNRKKVGYTTFVVHTNTMNNRDFEKYKQMFEENRDRLVSYADLLKLTPKKRGVLGNVKQYLMAVTKFVLVRVRG